MKRLVRVCIASLIVLYAANPGKAGIAGEWAR
jgi:hypothetical protein